MFWLAAAAWAQTRPESAATRPARQLTVRRLPLPIEGDASVPAACSFSPDGKFLAVARGYDHSELRIVDLARHAIVYEDRNVKSAANFPPAFDSKSARLAYTIEKGIATLDLVDGTWKEGRTFALPVKPWIVFPRPRALAWLSDGRSLAIAEEGEAHELDLVAGGTRKLDCGKARALNAVVLDGSFGVSCFADGGYETAIFSKAAVVDRIRDVAILATSGDGASWLTAQLDRKAGATAWHEGVPTVEIRDAKTRRSRARLSLIPDSKGPSGPCHAAFSFDGSVLVTGDFLRVDIRDGFTGAALHTIKHYETNRVVAIGLSPDGRRLVTMGRPTEREDPDTRSDGVILWELSFE
jgi:WD40 repeat protein